MPRRFAACLAVLLAAPLAAAQPSDRPLTTAVECPGYVPGCDIDFFQTEVGFARFVRDQADADVFVLVVDQDTGGGGEQYTLLFQGRRGAFAGRRDTLVAATPPGASDDDQRRAILSRLSLGLAGFASRTGLAGRLAVTYAAPDGADTVTDAEEVDDPWNSWVFRVDGQGFFRGQAQSSELNLFGSFSAQRVTEALKVSVRPRASYSRDEFELSEGGTLVSDNASYGVNGGAVVSLSSHWSAGAQADVLRSTFSNYDLRVQAGPAIEYNLYPYREATQRQIRFFYQAGVEAAAYRDTTIFLKASEVLPTHSGGVAAEFAQPWGSVDVFADARQYLSKPDKYNVGVGGGVDLRLFRGFTLRVDGRYSRIQDQINLPADRATDGEILTGQQELPTSFSYFGSVGVSYSFGSIYNQVVNARFGN